MTLPLSFDEILLTTRAVRKRLDLDRPVPLELIRECLELALQAPSGSNAQGWEWIVITDPDQRAAVGEFYRRATIPYLDSQPDDGLTPAQLRMKDSARWLAEKMGVVPVLVIPCIHVGPDGLAAGNQTGMWGSILPAAWSFMLAARSRGLGTAWTTLHLQYEKEVAQLLGLPDDLAQALLIPTAFYTGETFKLAPRKPLDDVLHVDRW